MQQMALYWKKFEENSERHYNGYVAPKKYNITQQKGYEALENNELLYLPANHSLEKKQFLRYDQLYNISKYKGHELPFCITVPSFNNIENNRYQKCMMSLMKQDYKNFHIVFIDDVSDDDTLIKTEQYLKEVKFPQKRVTYIQNL